VTLRAQLAEQSSTLLDNHPRIKELKAQISDLDKQIRDEAARLARSFENDARIAGARVESLQSSLDQLKVQAVSTNGQDVELRALEREAKAQRDLLESYLAKYREANTRENIEAGPADGRITWDCPAASVYDFIRALTRPYPGAFSSLDGKQWWIWEAVLPPDHGPVGEPGEVLGPVRSPAPSACGQLVACGSGAVILLEVQDDAGTTLRGQALSEQQWTGKRFETEAAVAVGTSRE